MSESSAKEGKGGPSSSRSMSLKDGLGKMGLCPRMGSSMREREERPPYRGSTDSVVNEDLNRCLLGDLYVMGGKRSSSTWDGGRFTDGERSVGSVASWKVRLRCWRSPPFSGDGATDSASLFLGTLSRSLPSGGDSGHSSGLQISYSTGDDGAYRSFQI